MAYTSEHGTIYGLTTASARRLVDKKILFLDITEAHAPNINVSEYYIGIKIPCLTDLRRSPG